MKVVELIKGSRFHFGNVLYKHVSAGGPVNGYTVADGLAESLLMIMDNGYPRFRIKSGAIPTASAETLSGDGEDGSIEALLSKRVADVISEIPNLSDAELEILEFAEANGANRVTLTKAISDEWASRSSSGDSNDDLSNGDAGTVEV